MGDRVLFLLFLKKMNKVKANYLFEDKFCLIKKSIPQRDWMDQTQNKFAYRCLPLVVANQLSWDVVCPSSIKAYWNGGDTVDSLTVEYLDESKFAYATSLFGYGILTFHVDFILTTSEVNSIYVKGPTNYFKKNIQPLEGIVETHWLPFTFTFNWKFQETGEVIFAKGEPMFSFFPLDLNYIESFCTEVDLLINDNKLNSLYQAYNESRTNHVKEGFTNGSDWQKYYMKGVSPLDKSPNEDHKTKIDIKPFIYE